MSARGFRILREMNSRQLLKSALDVLKKYSPKAVYNYAKRHIMNGAERDAVFISGMKTVIKLAGVDRATLKSLITNLKHGEKRSLRKTELQKVSKLLRKAKFTVQASRKVILFLRKADGPLIKSLVKTLQ